MDRKSTQARAPGPGFSVGAWRVEPDANRIARGEREVPLEPKVMQVLECLAERPGKTVTKEQFLETVWSETVVTDDALARCISELRKALGDDARNPTYVETIRKTGYRLIAPVSAITEPTPTEPTTDAAEPEAAEPETAEPNAAEPNAAEPNAAEPEAAGAAPREERLPARVERSPRPATHWSKRMRAVRQVWRRLGRSTRIALAAGLLLLAALPVAWQALAPGGAAPSPPHTVPFTSFPGEEFDAALAPDGQRVAFAWDGGDLGNVDVYLKQPGSETPLRLTDDPAEERHPTWSPDGQKLAFVRFKDGESSIVLVPALGGSERVLARFGSRRVRGLVWSPQGGTLALAAQNAPYEASSIFLLSIETLEKHRLTDPPAYDRGDTHPAFSPDGETLAFTRGVVERVEDVYTVPVAGGEPRRVTRDGAEITGLDWAPGGKEIVFASNRSGRFGLWKVAPAGGAPAWVSASGQDVHQPSIARTGGRMTLTQRSFDTNIWHLRRAAGFQRLTAHPQILSTRWDSNPDISPGGERIAFASKRSGHFEIWTCQRDGSAPVQLTSLEHTFTSTPRWSPGGSHIAFASRSAGQSDVYVVPAAGAAPQRLTDAGADEVAPAWSRDGSWVYFASNRSGRWQIWKVAARGGTPRQVTTEGGFAAAESPDGRWLYYVKKSTPGLWRRPLREGAEERVLEALEPYDWGNWAVTEQGVYFVRRTGETPALVYYNPRSGRTVRLALLEGLPRHPALAVGPGGRWFSYAKVDRSESDILMVENFR